MQLGSAIERAPAEIQPGVNHLPKTSMAFEECGQTVQHLPVRTNDINVNMPAPAAPQQPQHQSKDVQMSGNEQKTPENLPAPADDPPTSPDFGGSEPEETPGRSSKDPQGAQPCQNRGDDQRD